LIRQSDKSLSQIGRDLGVPACTLKWWKDREEIVTMPKRAQHTKPPTKLDELEAEVRRLQKEKKVLLMDRALFK
jgi:hypothetical protein